MSLLIHRQDDVVAHWKATVQALGCILPERVGRLAPRRAHDGYGVELTSQGTELETTIRHTGGVIPIVPFLDVPISQPSTYWLAWHERWRQPQRGVRRKRMQFGSSTITVYAGRPGSSKRQVLRAEWAGAAVEKVGGKEEIRFQGDDAAHPHWHLAGVGDVGEKMHRISEIEDITFAQSGLATFVSKMEDADLVRDRNSLLEGNDLMALEPAWARIHLATSARWAQEEWHGPGNPAAMHAAAPASCKEIRSWVISCARYLQSELQKQVRRARL